MLRTRVSSSSAAVETCLGSSSWRYRLVVGRPASCCAAVTSRAGVASVSTLPHDSNKVDTGSCDWTNVAYPKDIRSPAFDAERGQSSDVDKGPAVLLEQHDSAVVLHQHDVLEQCYSLATLSAMARLIGHHDVEPNGRGNDGVVPKSELLAILKTSSGTPLADASAALALLCESGQYDAVIEYGNPLLEAAAAAAPPPQPAGPLGAAAAAAAAAASGVERPQAQLLPDLQQLTGDLALSVALAHISLAAGEGSGGSCGGPGLAAVGGGSGSGLEEAYGHLKTALQALSRHGVAPVLQLEVAYCLQGVAVAFAEEVLRSTPPVAATATNTDGSGTNTNTNSHAGAAAAAPAAVQPQSVASASASGSASASAAGPAAAHSFVPPANGGGGGSRGIVSPAAAAALRARALRILRGALWRTTTTATAATLQQQQATTATGNPHHHNRGRNDPLVQPRSNGTAAAGGGGGGFPGPEAASAAAAASAGPQPPVGKPDGGTSGGVNGNAQPGAAHEGGSGVATGAAGGPCWPPVLTADERAELMAPLRGLLTAVEHISLYGPVASGQKPYAAVQLSDQELYDLAVAHLAQGVTTGWPQHVLQALSYFERIAKLQIAVPPPSSASSASSLVAGPAAATATGTPAAAAAATAVDLSFERSVCEALLGRNTKAASADVRAPAKTSAGNAVEAAVDGREASGGGAVASSPYLDEQMPEGDEAALLQPMEAHLAGAFEAAGGGDHCASGGSGALFSVDELRSYDSPGASAARDSVRPKQRTKKPQQQQQPSGQAPARSSSSTDAALPAFPAGGAAAAAAQLAAAPHAPASSTKEYESDDDVSRLYGWAESWLELSVLPCFPETATMGATTSAVAAATATAGRGVAAQGAPRGTVSLARWFADPRVVLFNKLLSVRAGEAVNLTTAALGSAVTHASDASRQRLWQLWQAAAAAVAGANKAAAGASSGQQTQHSQETSQQSQQQQQAAEAAKLLPTVAVAAMPSPPAPAPLVASRLLAQSRSALQEMVPRAAAAASAVAAAAAAVGSAAASSPRAVAAAASRMVPFGLPRWGAVAAADGGPGVGVPAATVPAHGAAITMVAEAEARSTTMARGDGGSSKKGTIAGKVLTGLAAEVAGHSRSLPYRGPAANNNVVPFASSPSGGDTISPTGASSPPADAVAAPPKACSLVDVAPATPSATAAAAPPAAANAVNGASEALWTLDAEGHMRPRMVARVVQDVAAGLKDRVAALPYPILEWTADDEAQAVRRVAAVAAQAVCLGALAAYVGHRILAGGGLQAGGSGVGGGGWVPDPLNGRALEPAALDASKGQLAAAVRAVGRWLGLRGMAAAEAAPPGDLAAQAATAEDIGRLAALYGRAERLDEAAAAALLRGWAAARAAAPGLADPRDRGGLLEGLLAGSALRKARAEADRGARLGRRVEFQRLEVEVEQLRHSEVAARHRQPHPHHPLSRGEVEGTATQGVAVMTAVLVTAGTEATSAAPRPAEFCCRQRLTVTFHREEVRGPRPGLDGAAEAAAEAGTGRAHVGGGNGVERREVAWRVVDVRDAPPALY